MGSNISYIHQFNENVLCEDDALLNLACAVVTLAYRDVKAHDNIHKLKSYGARCSCERHFSSAISFIESAWYSTLTLGRDGKADMDKLRRLKYGE